ncbi:hypothetical protein CDO73_12560 [Saccharibacillus sp. O23]|uniref:DUF429 domain-containing protein n=1 Tax=Saccharibacillus sp. O23 TaxID=2009338 RepID=UPI000B4E31D1|nr:DUF429 domain-containing protein [Saccharibacillus sp. O23]OWR29908.1 hypothetical protein CDO73_12560 [Saccharibacillus sp. O23]
MKKNAYPCGNASLSPDPNLRFDESGRSAAPDSDRPARGYRGIGVDGCPGGWIAVVLEESGNPQTGGRPELTAGVYPDISSLWEALKPLASRDLVLIDMPIGLPEGADGIRNRVEDRNCDRDCRKLLPKRRKSSVFPVPARQALRSDDPSAANAAATERKLSSQSLNILPKIRELDDFIAQHLTPEESGAFALPLAESHPEVAFMRLNAGEAPLHGKKTAEGLAERFAILEQAGIKQAESERLTTLFPRKQAACDDLLDAAALAISALRIVSGRSPARRVTEDGRRQFDYDGRLEMNIVHL